MRVPVCICLCLYLEYGGLIHLGLRGKGEWGSGRVGHCCVRVRICRVLQVHMWAHTCTCIHMHARVYVYMHIPRMWVFIHPVSHRGNAMKGSRGYKGDSSRGKGAETTGCIIVHARVCGLYACTYTCVCVCVYARYYVYICSKYKLHGHVQRGLKENL